MMGDFLKVMLRAKEVRDREYPTCPWVVHVKGQRVKSFDHGWTALMKRLGMSGVLFHDPRRTGVRNLVRAGMPETVAMKTSGHKTRSVFDRYNIISEENLREAANRLDDYIQRKMVTLSVTLEESSDKIDANPDTQSVDIWRRGWGSNPRSRCQDSSFRDCPIRPLSHLSAWQNSPYARVGLGRMYRRCDWLGELTLGRVIFQSVFFPFRLSCRYDRFQPQDVSCCRSAGEF